jgi:DNA-binding response OmpR family regulator
MKILVVDDEESLCMYYASELKDEGYDIFTANNEKDAIELFKKTSPDIVTLDIAMPSIGEKLGLKIMRRMQEMKPSVRIIILSAFDFSDDIQTWSADAYITKSFDCGELKNIIKSFSR